MLTLWRSKRSETAIPTPQIQSATRQAAMADRFEELITSRERLRGLHKLPSHRASNKVIDHIDDICRRFIAACPFVMVASRGADGRLDLSPKGDPPGFVAVLHKKTLAIPDRLGNNRLDTFENLLAHPDIGLFFMIPGNGDTLRVSGKGHIVRDGALQNRLAVNGKAANLALCPKCIVRSRLWKQDLWPDRTDVPSLAEAMVAHGALTESIAEIQAIIENDAATRLY
jgi:PPOX class probable FMN-dependent enzyme